MTDHYNYFIHSASKFDYPELLQVWKCSVKATHGFLSDKDFLHYQSILPTFFPELELHCIKDHTGRILGFTATKEGVLEMLFVRDNCRGMGIGKALLVHAKEKLNVDRVDVNQQNEAAAAFYNKHGFKVIGRSDSDGFGKPYPILHMQLVS